MTIEDRPDLEYLAKDVRGSLLALADASADGPDTVDFDVDFATGRLLWLRGEFGEKTEAPPEATARDFLATNAGLFGLDSDLGDLGEPRVSGDRALHVVRMHQMVGAERVYGAGARVELNRSGIVTMVTVRLADASQVRRKPAVGREEAVNTARRELGVYDSGETTPELVLIDVSAGDGQRESTGLRAAWLFTVAGPEGKVDVLVDGLVPPIVIPTREGGIDVEDLPSELPRYHVSEVTGVPDFVTFGPNGTRTSGSASGDAKTAALSFFTDHPLMFGTGDVPNQLRVVAVQQDPGAPFQTHVVLQQRYGGLEVLGCELRVHLSQALNVTSISGNYLRDPRVVPEAQTLQFEARDIAVAEVGQLRTQQGIPDDAAKDVQDGGLVIFPGDLARAPSRRNRVAWRFRFPEATVFVDARAGEGTGGLVYAYPHRLGADRRIYDALGRGEISVPLLVMENGVAIPGTPQNSEVAPADAFVRDVLGFYAGLGRDSWDGRDGSAELVTNSKFTVTPANPAHWDIFRNQMWFQKGAVNALAVGHEFTHGVTMSTAFLMPIDEPGALNEHYSDVMGAAAIRDLTVINQSPSNYAGYVPRSAACSAPEAVLTSGCDGGNVHINNGIGNRAANLLGLGDGPGGTHAGIGYNRLARLFLDTLTTRLHPWSMYIDERLNTWEAAQTLAARGVLVPSDANPAALVDFSGVAHEVSWAFGAVGVDPALIAGWYSVPGSPAGQHSGATVPYWTGQLMPACKLIGDMEMVVQLRDPAGGTLPLWDGRSRVNGPGGGTVGFPGGVFGASIVSHHVGTNIKDTVVTYFHSGFLPFEFGPVIIPMDDPACPPSAPGGPPPQSEFVTWGGTHWHDFLGGGKGTDKLNASSMVRAPSGSPCTIDVVEVELLDRNGQIIGRTQPGQAPAVFQYGPFGMYSFGVEVVNAMLGTSDPAIDVHWWFDVGSAVRYRVHYYCTGDSCDLR
jgi:Zn-dependent metalloprotease